MGDIWESADVRKLIVLSMSKNKKMLRFLFAWRILR